MSTGLVNIENNKIKNLNRFAELAKLNEVVFHADDLANLWQITNKNTLYTTLKRYTAQGLLYRIYKGFYAIKEVAKIDSLLLGVKALHGSAYVSTETVLADAGIILQAVPAITLVSGLSKKFTIGDHLYLSRQLGDSFRYHSVGITTSVNGVRKAGVERAVADMMYFNPKAYFDGESLIDWTAVKNMQEEIGYPLTPQRYG